MPQNPDSIINTFKNIQLVIFDLDGTIYDQKKLRMKLYVTFLLMFLIQRIKIIDLKIVMEFRKQREKHKGFGSASLDEDQYKWCADQTKQAVEKVKKTIDLLMFQTPLKHLKKAIYPNVISFINALRKNGFKVAVYSDYPVDEKLSAFGVKADKTFCSTNKNISQLKPTPKGLNLICQSFQCAIDKALFIGDREDTDGESARMAGMQFLKVETKQARKGTFYDNLIKLSKNE